MIWAGLWRGARGIDAQKETRGAGHTAGAIVFKVMTVVHKGNTKNYGGGVIE